MADELTFLEKYKANLLKTTSPVMDKLEKSFTKFTEDSKERDREPQVPEPLPDFLSRRDGAIPTAADILGSVPKEKTADKGEATMPKAGEAESKTDEAVAEELPPESLDDVLKDLNALVGMEEIKTHVRTLINLLKIQAHRKAHELPVVEIGLHQAYLGNPGTGKTTLARLIGRVYKAAGRLSKGHLIETDRGGLVGGYVGQTAIKTQEKLNEAAGGVLFVDEAYSLVPETGESDFGQEAITTILKYMEDNRDDFVFIAAGYPDEMKRFLDSNPGFVSRFNDTITFPDYSGDELFTIFNLTAAKNDYVFSKSVEDKIREDFDWFVANKNRNFANGRLARKYFEAIVETQANRLAKNDQNTKNQLRRVTLKDLPQNLEKLI